VFSLQDKEASAEVVGACYRTAYGGAVLPRGEVERLRREVERLSRS
jgi:hypothetical protein